MFGSVGTDIRHIEETTIPKAGGSVVFDVALEREGKKYYSTGY